MKRKKVTEILVFVNGEVLARLYTDKQVIMANLSFSEKAPTKGKK